MRFNHFWATCLIAMFLWPSSVKAQLFHIASPVFAGFVSDDGNFTIRLPAVRGNIARSSLRDGALFFTFRVIGSQRALDYLKSNLELPVKVTLYDGPYKLKDYNIGITQENWYRNRIALTNEFEQTGIFNWRTKLFTEHTDVSTISAKIRDANDNFVLSLDEDGSYEAVVNLTP